MIITPGYIFNSTEPVTHTKLNQLGNPTGALEPGDVTVDLFEQAELLALLGEGGVLPNYFRNGNFAEPYWTLGSTDAACPVGQTTYRADWWFCRPEMVLSSGIAAPWVVLYGRADDGPDNKSLNCASLSGATGIQAVDFGQDIPLHLSAALRTTVTFSFKLFNGSGVSFTPSVKFETPDSAPNGFNNTSEVAAVTTGGPASMASWTSYAFTADLSAATNIALGLRAMIHLPATALDGPLKYVLISQCKIERGAAASGFVVERDEVGQHTESTPGGEGEGLIRNFLINAQFGYARWLVQPGFTTTRPTQRTFGAEGWFVIPGGGDVKLDRMQYAAAAQPVPGAGIGTGMKITGTATVSNPVQIGQFIGVTAAEALQQAVTFSIYLKNNAAGAFTPNFYVDTCNSANSFESVTTGTPLALTSCAVGSWTRLEATVDLSALTNSHNGFVIYIDIPTTSLNTTGQSIELAQGQLEIAIAASDPVRVPEPTLRPRGLTEFRNLTIANTIGSTGTSLDVSAEELLLRADDGTVVNTGPFSNEHVASGASGLGGVDTGSISDGWWAIWAVSNGGSVGLLLSQSSIRPTLPANYRWYGLLGWVRRTGTFRLFRQRNKYVWQSGVNIVAEATPASTAWQLFDSRITAAIPPGTIRFGGTAGVSTGAAIGLALSPTGDDADCLRIALSGGPSMVGFTNAAPYQMLNGLMNSWKKDTNGRDVKIDISNYELN